jgi:hypothetical protein
MNKLFRRIRTLLAAFSFVVTYLSFGSSSIEETKVLSTLSNLKKGWETKDIEVLKTCFNPVPALQIQTYQELFKIAENFRIQFVIRGIKVNHEFASVDAELTQSWELLGGNSQRFPKTSTKHIAYIMKKMGDAWFISGTMDFSKINTSFKVTPESIPSINLILSNMVPSARLKLANEGYQPVAPGKGRLYWTADPQAATYVASLADQDLTKIPSGKLLWKLENIRETFVFIPDSIISTMVTGKIYYLHVFSYDANNKALRGQIMQVVR